MNKELLISIHPQHAVNILNGKKTLELRKSVPKDYVGWVNVYVTKGKPYIRKLGDNYFTECSKVDVYKLNGKVAFRFWFDEFEYIAEFSAREMLINVLDRLSITKKELKNYLKGKYGYAWHIKQLEIFDKPKGLSEFQTRKLIKETLYWYGESKYYFETLKKPPQRSVWVYTKELENE